MTIAHSILRHLNLLLLGLRNRHFGLWDLLTQPLCVLVAFWLRTESLVPPEYGRVVLLYALLGACIKVGIYYVAGAYRRLWRYAGTDELMLLALATFAGSVSLTLAVYGLLIPFHIFPYLPRSIPLIDFALSLGVASLPRIALCTATSRKKRLLSRGKSVPFNRRVIVVGAGQAGVAVLREINNNPHLGFQPVALVDDDPQKQGLEIMGCRVVGTLADIAPVAARTGAAQAIIAMPSAGGKVVRRMRDLCRESGLELFTVPGIYELIDGRVSVERLRSIQIEDLLRRDPVETDRASVRHLLAGRCALVTGGGGSIGSELCRQIADCGPSRLVVLGHGENSLYQIQQELRHRCPAVKVEYVVADIRDRHRLNHIFSWLRPDVVFHAAAHKHVPLMEQNVQDAVTNNVQGTWNLVEVCAHHDVPRFVMISTDKAVNPTSVMGVTKRVAEQIVQSVAARTGKAYVAVRFGNVLGSRGSVVPLFQRQIAAGGPVTVTDVRVKRYFMTIPEAVQLVLQAGVLGNGGEVFVLDMGEPIRIIDLARDMIELAGLEVGQDIDIEVVGLRPGEKLFEELVLDQESYEASACEKVYVLRQKALDEPRQSQLFSRVEELVNAAREGDGDLARRLLHELVPDYVEPKERSQKVFSGSSAPAVSRVGVPAPADS